MIDPLAPHPGVIRVGINVANPFLAKRTEAGALVGVAMDLSLEIARFLDQTFEPVPYDSAGRLFEAVDRNEWDLAFLAIETSRAEKAAFTKPYAMIEGVYLVKDESRFQTIQDIDAPGVAIAVGKNAAYDLHLSRTLKHAHLLRTDGPAEALRFFMSGEADVAAGVRKGLEAAAHQNTGLRLLPGSFMTIPQGIAVPKARVASLAGLQTFLDTATRTGLLARILGRHV